MCHTTHTSRPAMTHSNSQPAEHLLKNLKNGSHTKKTTKLDPTKVHATCTCLVTWLVCDAFYQRHKKQCSLSDDSLYFSLKFLICHQCTYFLLEPHTH